MLSIAVCIKQVPDPASVEVDPLTGAVAAERLAYIINPPDGGALELALRWRNQAGGHVHVVSCGPERADPALRVALAVGADTVQRVWHPALNDAGPAATAAALAAVLRPLAPDLLLCGNRSTDRGSGQVPAHLAAQLQLAQATGVVGAELCDDGTLLVERKLERGRRQRLRVQLPAMVALESAIVELRYAALPAHMAAARATIPVVAAAPPAPSQARLTSVGPPRPRPRQMFIPDPNLSPRERMESILHGGVGGTAKRGQVLNGTPETQAKQIIAFLRQRGLLEE